VPASGPFEICPQQFAAPPVFNDDQSTCPARQFLSNSQILLAHYDHGLLLFERQQCGLQLTMVARSGERYHLDADRPSQLVAPLIRDGSVVLGRLAAIWPDYAAPQRLGIVSDGKSLCFSPDDPEVSRADWFASVLRGDIRLSSLMQLEKGHLGIILTENRMGRLH
jgi:hypothetical protein